MEQKNSIPQRQPRPIDALKSILKAPSVEEQFKNTLKENSGAFIASIIDLYNGDQYLQQCEPKQVVMEALKAATLKLPINKALGFSYLVPYKTKSGMIATCQIGYKGYIQLAMRTGKYRIINADLVYEGELKTVDKLTGEIDFRGEKQSNEVVGYFAHIEMVNGFAKTLFMTKEKIINHAKKYSKSYGYASSAWQTEFDAMAKKTVIRNLLSHYGYLSVEMVGAIDEDIRADTQFRDQDVREHTGKKTFDIEKVEFEEVQGDNGGEDDSEEGYHEDPGF
jgi:recombination protein RecT